MRFCNKCGAPLDDDAMFCAKCGAPAPEPAEPEETPAAAPEETVLEEAASAPDGEQTPEAEAMPAGRAARRQEQQGGKRRLIIILAAVAVVAVAAVAAAVLLLGGGSAGPADAMAQCDFNNTGRFAYDSQNLYFVGDYYDSDDETSLYSTPYDGGSKRLISDDGDISRIRIRDGKILYYASGDDERRIGMMGTDGAGDKTILSWPAEDEVSIGEFDLAGGKLYYIADSTLHVCSAERAEDQVLAENVKDFVIDGKTMYYSADGTVYVYDLRKQTAEELCRAAARDLVYENGTLYFKTDNGLYCAPVSEPGVVRRVVDDDMMTYYVIDGDTVYYISALSSDEIKTLAEYMEDDVSYSSYYIALIGTGQLMRAPKTGGEGEKQPSDQLLLYSLHGYPQGFYGKISLLADKFEKVQFK